MWGALIAAGASILGNVLQRNAQEDAYNRQEQQMADARARSNAFYNRQYYMDGTQRADTQRALTQARQNLLRANMAASGRNAVMGGTNATAAAAKEISSASYADAVAAAAANAEARKDRILEQQQARNVALDTQKMNLDAANDQAHAEAIGNATNQIGQLASSAISAQYAAGNVGATKVASSNSAADATASGGAAGGAGTRADVGGGTPTLAGQIMGTEPVVSDGPDENAGERERSVYQNYAAYASGRGKWNFGLNF